MSAVLRSLASFDIRPFDAPLGAEVIGLDLSRSLGQDDFARIHRAHLDYHVLVFRDQRITPAQQVAFSRRFGPLQIHVLRTGDLQHPGSADIACGVDPDRARPPGNAHRDVQPAAGDRELVFGTTSGNGGLVFGTTSGNGGLGWYIFQSRNELYTDKVFAAPRGHRHRPAGRTPGVRLHGALHDPPLEMQR
jgi:hypothetical protein